MSVYDDIVNGRYKNKYKNENESVYSSIVNGTYVSSEEKDRLKKQQRELDLQRKTSKLTSYNNAKKDRMKQVGEEVKRQSTIRKKQEEFLNNSIRQQVNNINYNFNKEHSQNIKLPVATSLNSKNNNSITNYSNTLLPSYGQYKVNSLPTVHLLNEKVKDESGFIKSSDAFDDGYQFGDVSKTVGSTLANAGTSVIKGMGNVAEGVSDFGTHIAAQVIDWAGNKQWADRTRKEAMNNRNEELFNNVQKNFKGNSILGDKSNQVLESVGYSTALMPFETFNPYLGTAVMFSSATGSGLNEAYSQEGVNDTQAWIKGVGSGLIETATERMFGLFGTSGLDTGIANTISSRITSGFGKSLVRMGVQGLGEAAEEGISYTANHILDRVIDNFSNGKGAKFSKDWNWEELGQQMGIAFVSASLMGMATNVAQVTQIVTNENLNLIDAINEAGLRSDVKAQAEDLNNEIESIKKELRKNPNNSELTNELKSKYAQLNMLVMRNDFMQDNTTNNSENTLNNNNNTQNQQVTPMQNKVAQNGLSEQNKSIANNQETLYNNIESESGINGQFNRTTQTGDMGGNISQSRLVEEQKKFEQQRYQEWEQSIKPKQESNFTYEGERSRGTNTNEIQRGVMESQRKDAFSIDRYKQEETTIRKQGQLKYTERDKIFADKMKQKYNKNVFIYDDTNTSFGGGLSYMDRDTILFGRNTLNSYGYDFLEGHEILEDINKNYKNVADYKIKQLKEKLQQDENFGDVFLKYLSDMKDDVYEYYIDKPDIIAKEIIGDLNGLRNAGIDYKTLDSYKGLNENIVLEIQNTIKELENKIYNNKELEKTSSFNLPVQEKTMQDIRMPISQKVQADINMEKFKKANNIKGDIISNTIIPISEEIQEQKVANILSETPKKVKESDRKWAIFKANVFDKGIVFEELSHKTNNRELQGKWDYTLSATARGQNAIGNARYEFDSATKQKRQISKSLEEIKLNVGDKIEDFSSYMYHQLNIDRMTLEERFGGDTGINYERKNEVKNKPVFGESITADISQNIVAELEQKYPEFKSYAQDVYDFLNANMKELVDNGVISKESADYMSNMYPHYVPIGRANVNGNAISVLLDTGRTGINTPIKLAKGGNGDILPLFDTIAQRTLQTYRASARNNFGVELKNTLNTISNIENVDVDTIVDTMGQEIEKQELLQKGTNGNKPTFTVFENGQKVTYEITKDMYDALKPVSDSSLLGKTIKPLNKLSNFRRGVLTEYNPLFMITNAIKDAQDVLINSQHSAKTYAKFPEAYTQIVKKGYWYQEYVQNGGEQNSYFNANDSIFESDVKKSKLKGVVTIPLRGISNINNVIELAPRLAEYITSRESGRSIETSMLDASRVTTNFKAGGDVTKFVNRNGGTFLNASVQGMMQQIRNITEAHSKGLKGYAVLATKYAIAGLPAIIFNNLIWDDDDDYDELQDYVKDNYYCIAKYGEGQFIRIPKGRMLATIQKVVSNASEYITDGKKINIDNFSKDFWEDLQFAMDNVAPNNPLDNNVISPIIQTITNTSWYGDDIVPSRLQDKPNAEQYDETIDSFSIWLGQKLNASPYKINYLLDQYGGGISDIVLPKLTKQAENNPIEDKFTTNSVMKSKYPGEFFEKIDELKVNNNSEKATDEDKIKYKYMSNIQKDMSDLYDKKRKIQNSNDTDKEKKEKLKELQKQINILAKNALTEVNNLKVDGITAKIDGIQYYKATNLKDGSQEWEKISEKEVEKNKNISLKTYANYKEKVAKETIKQRKNGNIKKDTSLKNKDEIQILLDSTYSDKEKEAIYENYIKSSKDTEYAVMKQTGINIDQYLKYKQQDFSSDKNEDGTINGKSISNSKKKVVEYLNAMKITYNQRLLLYAMNGYTITNNQKTQLANYVKDLKINKEQKLKLYNKFSGFTVYKDGSVTW